MPDGRAIQIGWKVSSLATNMASVRYRAVLPMLALEGADVHSRLFRIALEENLDGLDVLVIVKSFTTEDLALAQLAKARGIRVVLDLCDNIFIGDYAAGKNSIVPAQMFMSLAELASCIVATTEPLADVIRAHVPGVPVAVIPDGIETAALHKQVAEALRSAASVEKSQRLGLLRQRARNVARRVRVEGVRLIPSLLAYAARHGSRAVLRRIRARVHRRAHAELAAAKGSPAAVQASVHSSGESVPSARKILWFGNHGAEHARFGMLDILEFRTALETLASGVDVELVVISNHAQKYEQAIAPLAIPSRYVEWSPRAVDQWLGQADVVIVPNSLDAFSVCKSANRTVLALARGVPVVATPTPALAPLAPWLWTGEPLAALREILARPQQARAQAKEGYARAEALYGQEALRRQWRAVLDGLGEAQPAAPAVAPWLAVVLHLVQDLDLALPILRQAREQGLSCEAWCSQAVMAKSPRVFATLRGNDIPVRVLPDERGLRDFRFGEGTRALLTVAETNLGPHRIPRALTEAANRQGVFTATLQHGFENVGLTYDDHLQGISTVNFAAQRIYIWGPRSSLHPAVADDVRARCVPVGCPKDARVPPAELGTALPLDRPVIGVFENLHWHRYSDDYRKAFLDNVVALSREFTGVRFLVKPHHAGVWLTRRYEGETPAGDNLVIADPQQPPWERHTASALMPLLSAVITTPSTVALDAARLGLPVAVVAQGLDLPGYRPLPLLQTHEDWRGFVTQVLDPARVDSLRQHATQYVERVLVPGNAAVHIVDDLRAVVLAGAAA